MQIDFMWFLDEALRMPKTSGGITVEQSENEDGYVESHFTFTPFESSHQVKCSASLGRLDEQSRNIIVLTGGALF